MKKVYFHGECCVFEFDGAIPKDAKKLEPKNGRYILANSETTGNHHILEAEDGVDVYEKDGILYVSSSVEARVSCVMKDRHDTQILPAKKYFIKPAQEFDHLSQTSRAVAD